MEAKHAPLTRRSLVSTILAGLATGLVISAISDFAYWHLPDALFDTVNKWVVKSHVLASLLAVGATQFITRRRYDSLRKSGNLDQYLIAHDSRAILAAEFDLRAMAFGAFCTVGLIGNGLSKSIMYYGTDGFWELLMGELPRAMLNLPHWHIDLAQVATIWCVAIWYALLTSHFASLPGRKTTLAIWALAVAAPVAAKLLESHRWYYHRPVFYAHATVMVAVVFLLCLLFVRRAA
ncbi:MAG: hypothetical protein K1X53_09455 [Candidatus Sumerlaeaceae bacterium]|nr:hypothetical protein [Candidatus Sumerlaeaceae bacterium]